MIYERGKKGKRKDAPQKTRLPIWSLGGLFRRLFGCRFLHARLLAGSGGALFLLGALSELPEPFDTSGGVDILLLAGIERMAFRADFYLNRLYGRAGRIFLTAGARDDGVFMIGRMDSLFHTSLRRSALKKLRKTAFIGTRDIVSRILKIDKAPGFGYPSKYRFVDSGGTGIIHVFHKKWLFLPRSLSG